MDVDRNPTGFRETPNEAIGGTWNKLLFFERKGNHNKGLAEKIKYK